MSKRTLGRSFLNLIHAYNDYTERQPFKSITISSGFILGAGDLLMQIIEKYQNKQQISKGEKVEPFKFTFRRTLNMAMYGWAVFGPFCYLWYVKFLPWAVPMKAKPEFIPVTKKVLLDETLMSWTFYLSFLYGMKRIEGASHQEGVDKVKKDFMRVWVTDLMVWPWIQYANFWLVPIHMQAFVVNAGTVIWSAYLSMVSNESAH